MARWLPIFEQNFVSMDVFSSRKDGPCTGATSFSLPFASHLIQEMCDFLPWPPNFTERFQSHPSAKLKGVQSQVRLRVWLGSRTQSAWSPDPRFPPGHSLTAHLISSTYLHPINQVKEFASTYELPSAHYEFVHGIWKESRQFPPRARGAPHCATGESWQTWSFAGVLEERCISKHILLLPYRLISNIKPRRDQNTLESLKNVLAEGIGESEDLLVPVFLEGKISSLSWQFLPVQFEWNPVRDICLLEAEFHKSQS